MDMYRFLLKYEDLVSFLRRNPDEELHGLDILERFAKYVESLNSKSLDEAIYTIYNKWPNINVIELKRNGLKRAIQTKYYETIYGHEIPKNVKENDERCILDLKLSEDQIITPTPLEPPINDVPKKQLKIRKIRPKREKSEFSKKISEMQLEQVISWAKEIGVKEELITKHQGKPTSLAKMLMSNLIKKKLTH